jgi:hypothetical protein
VHNKRSRGGEQIATPPKFRFSHSIGGYLPVFVGPAIREDNTVWMICSQRYPGKPTRSAPTRSAWPLSDGLRAYRGPVTAPPSGVVGSPANQEEEGMDISVLGVDLGKNVCSVVGLDASGAVVMRREVRRETLIALAEKLPPRVVGMEACCGAHHLGLVFAARGHDVRLMSPEYVRPYGPTSRRRRTTIATPRESRRRSPGRRCGLSN